MNLILKGFIVVFVAFVTGASGASVCSKSPERVAVEKLLNIEIDSAETMVNQWPKGLRKDYYEGMILLVKAYNIGSGVDESLKTRAAKQLGKVIRKARFTLEDSHDPEASLILGLARMYRAGILITQNRKAKAYDDTFASRELLTTLVDDQPDMEDVYLPLGMYEFFLSKIPDDMKTKAKLLSLTGDRDVGLQFLERAVENSPTSAPEAARVLLVETNLSDTEMCRYQSLSREMEKRYPDNELLQLTRSIIALQCSIAQQEGREVAQDAAFVINEGCV